MTCADHPSQPDVYSRMLLRVQGIRTHGRAYRFEGDADQFWLALAGDVPEQVLWIKLDWRCCDAIAGFAMVTEVVTMACAELPTSASNQFHYNPPHWQALCGMTLQALHMSTGYEQPPLAAPLSVQLTPWVQQADMAVNVASARLLLDSSDLERLLTLLVSDEANLGHWALRSDVQKHLDSNKVWPWEVSWNASWNTPPGRWNDQAHFVALAHFRGVFQDFAVWWQTQTDWEIASRLRQGPTPGMWKAVGNLCAMQILLGCQLVFRGGYGGWLDHDGEEFGTAWYMVDGKVEFNDLARSLGAGITDWIRWMAWDEWHALLGSESGGFYVTTKVGWQKVLRAHMAWIQLFANLVD